MPSAVMIRTRLARCEITDTKPARSVAIKVLPADSTMNENLTRREILIGMAAAPFFQGTLNSQTTSSICFMSAAEMARLIRAKKLSAREALAAHLKQIELVNPKVNAIVTLVSEMAT